MNLITRINPEFVIAFLLFLRRLKTDISTPGVINLNYLQTSSYDVRIPQIFLEINLSEQKYFQNISTDVKFCTCSVNKSRFTREETKPHTNYLLLEVFRDGPQSISLVRYIFQTFLLITIQLLQFLLISLIGNLQQEDDNEIRKPNLKLS